ncbi:hypothetical protein ABT320_33805 [Streptomyces cellulosae]
MALFDELSFEVSDAFLGESEVGAGAFEPLLELAMLLGELVDAVLEGGVLGGQLLDGLAGDHLVEVAELAHEFTDPLTLSEDLLLAACQLGLGVQGPLPPGRLDPVVFLLGLAVVAAVVDSCSVPNEGPRLGVLVEERRGDSCSFSDGPDGQPAAFADGAGRAPSRPARACPGSADDGRR